MDNFSELLFLDKEAGYIYIKKFLWYTTSKVAKEDESKLNELILEKLDSKDGEGVMQTIADVYVERGLARGIEQGIEKGMVQGREEGIIITAKKMLLKSMDPTLISSVTGLAKDRILRLKNEL